MTSVERKIRPVAEIAEVVASLKAEGKKVVLCHGVFDLLHIGHIRYLNQAKEYGDVLIVSLTPDRFVDKGPDRPAFTETLRAEALASLGETDFVTINEWPTAEETLRLIQPDVYAKGDEFKNVEADPTGKIGGEAEVAKEIGAEIVFTSDIVFSSSNLINRYITKNSPELAEYLKMFRSRYSLEDVLNVLENMSELKVLVVGDTILDEYQITSALGKSSKDPILALKYQSHELYAGGALAVANHVANFAGEVGLVSMLGDTDRYEDFIREKLNPKVTPHFVTRPGSPTTLKRRFVDAYSLSKVMEIYMMNDDPLPLAVEKELCETLEQAFNGYDLVLVADFGHGLVTPELISILSQKAPYLAVNTQANAGNRGFNTVGKYPRVDFFSLAEHELRLETRDQVSPARTLLGQVGAQIGSGVGLVTQGGRGCCVWSSGDNFVRIPALNSDIVDRVGAGDALFSLASMGSYLQVPDEIVGFIGNVAGSLAVQVMGNDKSVGKQSMRKYITATLK